MTWLSPEVDLTPYTEPDLEQVKKEAYEVGYENGFVDGHLKAEKSGQKFYEDGYKRGLADAWEAARKIADMPYGDGEKIFGVSGWHIIEKRTADEVIEKLEAYEQKQFHIGDEVELDDGKIAILMGNTGSGYVYILYSDGSCGCHPGSIIVRKTGRHFSEIATILEKMRGKNDD